MFNFNKTGRFILISLITFAVVFSSGVYFGYKNRPEVSKIAGLLNIQTPVTHSDLDFEPFWQTWNIIESKYVGSGQLDRQEMVWGAISGLVGALDDPYSVFMPPKESEIFEENVRGDFGGVGMEIGERDGMLTVIAPLKGTPAERAGIRTGDKIIRVDNTSTSELSVDEAVQLIRGEIGTKVKLTILRDGNGDEPLEIEVIRDVITIPVLDTEQKDGGIFVIKLYSFSAKSGGAFRDALRKMVDSGSSKLIVDLRGNPGGYLEMAVDISSWFLPMGEVIAREQFGNGEEHLYRSKGYNIFNDLSMVILIDQGSASASEIMAGALKEHGIAQLVGKKTFGKGSVQELIGIDQGSSLKLTIAKWLTPNGNSISDNGLNPDVEVEYTIEDFEAKRDPQMEKAVELLLNK